MRVGIYGGSFNPPHKMHEKIIKFCLEEQGLDKIILVPTSNLYPKKDLASENLRFRMLEIIAKKNPQIQVSDYEWQHLTYTYQTMRHFKKKYPEAEICFIMGSDNFKELDTWKNYQEILENYIIYVIKRPGIPVTLKKEYQHYAHHIKILSVEMENISSTEIRKYLKEGKTETIKNKIDSELLDFLQNKEIYVKIEKEKKVNMEALVESLIKNQKTIATMESCTGGGVANAITNVEGASKILKFSAVTYSNEYKIKMGVAETIINEFSVYSMETAMEMSQHISEFAHCDYGVGITGKLNRADEENPFGEDNIVYVSIYNRVTKQFTNYQLQATKPSRAENKELVIESIESAMLHLLMPQTSLARKM